MPRICSYIKFVPLGAAGIKPNAEHGNTACIEGSHRKLLLFIAFMFRSDCVALGCFVAFMALNIIPCVFVVVEIYGKRDLRVAKSSTGLRRENINTKTGTFNCRHPSLKTTFVLLIVSLTCVEANPSFLPQCNDKGGIVANNGPCKCGPTPCSLSTGLVLQK